ncbi:TSUP family transporter [Aromatoleum toluvorans]|uniref:Probable membrane transporter protein n=1 Tax=Aromatoleum toluvorans TaxID=92002 RepID=A0ABX1PYU4_9RHOO|nr:sulfite exporter TauE/SafE family protein [Aromatoleum toluvorans]NMG44303.1 TSUP family transporter [Aromatoleum toluvorans]
MTAGEILLVGLAATMAGAMNSVAGGGTFFSFPALLTIGVPPVVANASNAVALWPASLSGAWAYRRELARFRTGLAALSLVALVGGMAGGVLLLSTGDDTFSQLIPWLLLTATVMFAASGRISALLARLRQRPADGPSHGSAGGLLFQLGVSIYGGFFGAGMGIVMIAALAIQGHRDIHDINALKNWLSAIIYSVAVVTFVVAGAVSWPHTLVMIVTAAIGGYWGAVGARKVPAAWLRRFIIGVGSILTTYYFLKTL